MIERNVKHLEIIKGYKKLDETTSIWTSESFTDIDAAITKGKTLYALNYGYTKITRNKTKSVIRERKATCKSL